jgi:hypothetical protein
MEGVGIVFLSHYRDSNFVIRGCYLAFCKEDKERMN